MYSSIKVLTSLIFSFVLSLLFANQVFAAEVTEEEKAFFRQLVFAEAGIESEEAQVAVAATILNRLASPNFPNTIKGVACQPAQFSCVRDGIIYVGEVMVTQEMIPETTIRAVERALAGEDPTEEALLREAERLGLDPEIYSTDGALYFYNPDSCSEKALSARANIKSRIGIGAHKFYKKWDK